ncbi:MAG: heparan-alpha-glucosaminide N-acetyltransferase [Hydrogenoanaerobacterium sp.]
MFKKKDLSHRVWFIDEMRGVFILLMILYHLLYDLVYIFGVTIPAFRWQTTEYAQLLIAGLFVFIAGVASRFSHNNLKRGAQCFALGMVMTVVTWLVLPTQLVAFGVLHMLGACMMLFVLLKPLLDKLPPLWGLIFCAAMFFLTFNTQIGYWGMKGWELSLPPQLYTTAFLFPLGFPSPGFWSSDYFPLLPWIFWYIGGSFAGVYIKEERCPSWFFKPHSRLLALIGRNTIYIYLLHQPLIYGVLYLLFNIIK